MCLPSLSSNLIFTNKWSRLDLSHSCLTRGRLSFSSISLSITLNYTNTTIGLRLYISQLILQAFVMLQKLQVFFLYEAYLTALAFLSRFFFYLTQPENPQHFYPTLANSFSHKGSFWQRFCIFLQINNREFTYLYFPKSSQDSDTILLEATMGTTTSRRY